MYQQIHNIHNAPHHTQQLVDQSTLNRLNSNTTTVAYKATKDSLPVFILLFISIIPILINLYSTVAFLCHNCV
jgi:hypothetical protein